MSDIITGQTITKQHLDELARTGDLATRLIVLATRRPAGNAKQEEFRRKCLDRCAQIYNTRRRTVGLC
jgi:hypothetical protein